MPAARRPRHPAGRGRRGGDPERAPEIPGSSRATKSPPRPPARRRSRSLSRQKITGMLLDVNLPGHQRRRPGPPGHGARAQRRAPHAHRGQRRHQRRALHAARGASTTSSSRSIWPISPAPSSTRSERRHTLLEGQQINQWLKEEVALRVAERRVEQANQERLSVATLEALVNALEAKDPYLRGHSARVADLSAIVAARARRAATR